MKFEIMRTSLRNSRTNINNSPCEEAIRYIRPNWYTPNMTEAEYNKTYDGRRKKWKEEGSNHIILKDGNVARQGEPLQSWSIELKSLKDLIKFSEKYEDLIISNPDSRFYIPCIEIVDDYLD